MLKYILPLLFLIPVISCAQTDSTLLINKGDTLIHIESMPEFPGGQSELMKFLGDNLKYPPEAKANGIMGKVFVSFNVDKDGTIEEVKILKSVHPLLDEECIRVVKLMPKWKPAYYKGEPTKINFNMPFNFFVSDNSPAGNAKDYNRRGKKAYDNKEYEKAVDYYNISIKSKKTAEAFYYRGLCKKQLTNDKGALKDIEKAKKLGSKEAEEYLKTIN